MLNPMQILQLVTQVQQSNNPMQALQNIVGNNPAFQRAMTMCNGKDENELKNIARNLAMQQGMSEEQFKNFINQFRL